MNREMIKKHFMDLPFVVLFDIMELMFSGELDGLLMELYQEEIVPLMEWCEKK